MLPWFSCGRTWMLSCNRTQVRPGSRQNRMWCNDQDMATGWNAVNWNKRDASCALKLSARRSGARYALQESSARHPLPLRAPAWHQSYVSSLW
jgi:hypothetical protein